MQPPCTGRARSTGAPAERQRTFICFRDLHEFDGFGFRLPKGALAAPRRFEDRLFLVGGEVLAEIVHIEKWINLTAVIGIPLGVA
jgi:hypothetical protein